MSLMESLAFAFLVIVLGAVGIMCAVLAVVAVVEMTGKSQP